MLTSSSSIAPRPPAFELIARRAGTRRSSYPPSSYSSTIRGWGESESSTCTPRAVSSSMHARSRSWSAHPKLADVYWVKLDVTDRGWNGGSK